MPTRILPMADSAALHGCWEMIRSEHAGEAAPDLVARRTEIELSAGAYAVRFDGQTMDLGSCEVGGAGPGTMRLRGESGPNAGRIIPCIYQHVGDRLRICYGLDGTAPTGFSTATGQAHYLATYRRKRM